MGWSFKASGLLSLFIALVNLGLVLWLWKSRKDYKFLVYTTLGLVLTFVSISRSDSVGWKLYNISLGVRNGVIIMALYQVENPGI